MATPTSPEEARRLIAGLLNDRTVLDSERNRLMEQAMDRIIPITTSEKGSILDRIRAEMRQEVQEEVLQEMQEKVLQEVRQAMQKVEESLATLACTVLTVLKVRGIQVKPAEKKRIRVCRDLKVLEAWLDRSLQVSSASELFK